VRGAIIQCDRCDGLRTMGHPCARCAESDRRRAETRQSVARRKRAARRPKLGITAHRAAKGLGEFDARYGHPPHGVDRFAGHGGVKAHRVYLHAYKGAR
jgi:hypothetical protein